MTVVDCGDRVNDKRNNRRDFTPVRKKELAVVWLDLKVTSNGGQCVYVYKHMCIYV